MLKEVMLRDIQLPAEYVKGLEGVLRREQETGSCHGIEYYEGSLESRVGGGKRSTLAMKTGGGTGSGTVLQAKA